jgi:hypothetical protein
MPRGQAPLELWREGRKVARFDALPEVAAFAPGSATRQPLT